MQGCGISLHTRESCASSEIFQFLPRDAVHKRGLCHRTVSVTFVYCVETATDMAVVAMEYE